VGKGLTQTIKERSQQKKKEVVFVSAWRGGKAGTFIKGKDRFRKARKERQQRRVYLKPRAVKTLKEQARGGFGEEQKGNEKKNNEQSAIVLDE